VGILNTYLKLQNMEYTMPTKEKLVAAGAEKLADLLLSIYEYSGDGQSQLDIMFTALEGDSETVIRLIKEELSYLKQSTEFINYAEASVFANKLYQLLFEIDALEEQSPSDAVKLMMEFIDLHEDILNRTNDEYEISSVFVEACDNLGKICGEVMPVEEIVDLVFTRSMNDNYGIYMDLIQQFKPALKEKGLKLLQAKFEKALTAENASTVNNALRKIDDCQNNV
jgi:hypothetical protein